MEEENIFQSIRISGWRQFEDINIKFHPNLTILTGSNGAGKSTILNILSSHLGISRPYLGVPVKNKSGTTFHSGISFLRSKLFQLLSREEEKSDRKYFGEVLYSNEKSSKIFIPNSTGLEYNTNIEERQEVKGFHMPSHRLMPKYKKVPHIPFEGIPPKTAFQLLIRETYATFQNEFTDNSVLFQLKTILSSWAAIGYGNSIIDSDQDQIDAYYGFISILKKVLPEEIGFNGLKIQPPDILLETDTGDFLIDAASGGLITLIEIAALIYACSLREEISKNKFVVTFDEPENHLHPTLQRALFPALVKAFPNVQFIVATHSPFIVSSLKEANVYALRYEQEFETNSSQDPYFSGVRRKIYSQHLDYKNRAGPASEVLREVLGVPTTLPVWVERDLETLSHRYQNEPITPETIEKLRNDISQAGLEDLFSDALLMMGRRR